MPTKQPTPVRCPNRSNGCPLRFNLTPNRNGYIACPGCGAYSRDFGKTWGRIVENARITELVAAQTIADYLTDNVGFDSPDVVYCEVTPEPEARNQGEPLGLRVVLGRFNGNGQSAEFQLTLTRIGVGK